MIERMRQLRMNLPDGGFTVQYKPDENALHSAYEYGYYFGCKLQNKPNTHQSKLVKCLVCGEIFDASLGICPVCGVGMDKCVPVEEEAVGHREDTNRRYIIAGGGIAALSAAEAIRRRDQTGTIVMVSAEGCLPINRPMLSKNMTIAARVKDSLLVKQPEWFQENNIEIRLSACITAIDPAEKPLFSTMESPCPTINLSMPWGRSVLSRIFQAGSKTACLPFATSPMSWSFGPAFPAQKQRSSSAAAYWAWRRQRN